MNQKLKQAGLMGMVTILSLAMIAIAPIFIGEADASSSKDPEFRAQHIEALKAEAMPSLQLTTVHDSDTRPGTDFVVTGDVVTFTVVYTVLNPADIDLKNVKILVTSDMESVKGELSGNYDIKSSAITVEIDAVDPASINAKIIG